MVKVRTTANIVFSYFCEPCFNSTCFFFSRKDPVPTQNTTRAKNARLYAASQNCITLSKVEITLPRNVLGKMWRVPSFALSKNNFRTVQFFIVQNFYLTNLKYLSYLCKLYWEVGIVLCVVYTIDIFSVPLSTIWISGILLFRMFDVFLEDFPFLPFLSISFSC